MNKSLLNKIIENGGYDGRVYRYRIVGGEYSPGTKAFGSIPHIIRKPLEQLEDASVNWEYVCRL